MENPSNKEIENKAQNTDGSDGNQTADVNENSSQKEQKIIRTMNRIITVVLVTLVLFGLFGLGAEYVIVKGPSTALRDTFVRTMLETRRFGFISYIFLSTEEVEAIRARSLQSADIGTTDVSLIDIAYKDRTDGESTVTTDYGLTDSDGDGIIIDDVVGKGYAGKMIVVLDPSRVVVGKPAYYGDYGETLDQMCPRYDAVGGINAGGFYDASGTGWGGTPAGLTVVDYEYYNSTSNLECFAGFDANDVLHVEYLNASMAQSYNIRDGVAFGPALVINGVRADAAALASGINPRTAIGQRADGAVLMLVIDGRQAHSIGATYGDLADIMLNYGAVNACNMDGGSSSSMYFNGEYINSCSTSQVRPLPTAFIILR